MSDIAEEELPFGLLSKNRALLGSNMVLKTREAENSRGPNRASAAPLPLVQRFRLKIPAHDARKASSHGRCKERVSDSDIRVQGTEY